MGRILALDFGLKRTGVAETDDLKLIASGLDTISSTDIVQFIQRYNQQHSLEIIVIGLPKRLNNEDTHSTQNVNVLAQHLKKTFPSVTIEMVDERFTSKMASSAMFQAGLGKQKRKQKELVDKVSATLILQSYLEQQRNQFSTL